MKINSVGSVCSGIEAASVAWKPLGFDFKWFSEIADFPSRVLKAKYPQIPNLGDMNTIPQKLRSMSICAPDLICGGTPCQAFSLAGGQQGLNDDRGNLTLRFVDIIRANDDVRTKASQPQTVVFWENVEGVLSDKTNAFGCFISSLAGFEDVVTHRKWPNAGIVHGPKRNIAWRVLDAKYFGLPQQRRRLYLLAGGIDFFPENILFERHEGTFENFPDTPLKFCKDGHSFEIFRGYTDCLYSAYGTKWNGNAAAYNGSLFIVQDGRIRRISPLEAERLMGFPDDYTNLVDSKKTNRYQATGNSWAVPVIKWIGQRIIQYPNEDIQNICNFAIFSEKVLGGTYIGLGKDVIQTDELKSINVSDTPEHCTFSDMRDIVSADAPEDIYISPVGCYGIVRRKRERHLRMNSRLEEILLTVSSQMSNEDIEKRSRIQKRGRFSNAPYVDNEFKREHKVTNSKNIDSAKYQQLSLYDLVP